MQKMRKFCKEDLIHIQVNISVFPFFLVHPQSLHLSQGKLIFFRFYPVLNLLLTRIPYHFYFPSLISTRLQVLKTKPSFGYFQSILLHVPSFLMMVSFRPRVHLEFSKKNPKTLAYQSLAKAEEGLTRDAKGITKTIRSCSRDEGLNIQNINSIGIHISNV